MSRLTASPFHKPSPFEFPRIPLSPPETMSDHLGSAHPTTISVLGGMPVDPHVEAEPVHRSHSPETAGARFRRVSSLAYHSSGLRDSRERAVQRSRSFVVVLPPPGLLHEHGQLGHTLSFGPRHRLAQGMLMPLFPTMYGQLAAIAKEFNFPSTTGICLYFHFTENGITATPRISDDSWQMIWSNVLDPSAPAMRVPIVGKLEFDIDIRHARWFSAWIASAHRERLDVPASVGPSTAAPSIAAHYREDSRATDLELNFDQLDSESVSPQSGRPLRSHVPRKLSLVDRLDSSLRAVARATPQTSSPERSASVHALSPIFQEDEPKTAKLVDSLEKRVNTWRASASLTSSALAAKGQTSLEPANLPNTMPLDDVADGEMEEELNLEDFTWSISSLGPNDWEDGSVASWDRLPSVHLAHRMESSVCMTPSDCTSFGPSDYTLPSPALSLERVFTPDIAHRMFEDCPPTPGTATSWGPPSEYPPSPMSFGWASSVDIGDRAIFSPPPTPMTATSWGPASWPPSPTTPYYVHTPDAGQRAFDPEDLVVSEGARLGWPYWKPQPTTISTPWSQVWPYISTNASAKPWGGSWPYITPHTSTPTPWSHLWPYSSYGSQASSGASSPLASGVSESRSSGQQVHGLSPLSVHLPCAYPSLKIYPSVYPHFDLYPDEPQSLDKELLGATSGYPNLEIYLPVLLKRLPDVQVVKIPWNYPIFDLYPPVYPFTTPYPINNAVVLPQRSFGYPTFEIYPSVKQSSSELVAEPSVHYSFFNLYPALRSEAPFKNEHLATQVVKATGYPDFDIYPSLKQLQDVHYPFFDLYPTMESRPNANVVKTSGYPDFEIYPPASRKRLPDVQVVKSVWSYPIFDLYPAVYPFTTPYPISNAVVLPRRSFGYPTLALYLSVKQLPSSKAIVESSAQYPLFDLYPAVHSEAVTINQSHPKSLMKVSGYPDFEIYPVVQQKQLPTVHYPFFDLYPASESRFSVETVKTSGYPDFDIYPPISRERLPDVQVTKTTWNYPIFDLYPAVYPFTTPYPTSNAVVPTPRSFGYPTFALYPSVKQLAPSPTVHYPFFDLYPPVESETGMKSRSFVKQLAKASGYPDLDIYPPVLRKTLPDVQVVKTAWSYPIFDLYPAIYPYIRPYPVHDLSPPVSQKQLADVQIVKLAWSYPIFDLYPAIYPFTTPYPAFVVTEKVVQTTRKTARSHKSLHCEVFPDGIVSTPTGTLRKSRDIIKVIARRSHRSLHDEVFPDGVVSTPSSTTREVRASFRPPVPSPRGGRLRGNSISTRPLSSAGPPPTYGLPPRPNLRTSTLDSVVVHPPTGSVHQDLKSVVSIPPMRSASLRSGLTAAQTISASDPALSNPEPLRRSVSSVTPTRTSLRQGLAPVAEVTPSALDRSASMGRRSVAPPVNAPLGPRKRDSVVLQRIRAFEETETESSRLSLKTLREFPLPPPPPTSGLPALPTGARRTSFMTQSRP